MTDFVLNRAGGKVNRTYHKLEFPKELLQLPQPSVLPRVTILLTQVSNVFVFQSLS